MLHPHEADERKWRRHGGLLCSTLGWEADGKRDSLVASLSERAPR
jgi:hypothetical protein